MEAIFAFDGRVRPASFAAMIQRTNQYGLHIGDPVPDWEPRERPPRAPMHGRFCRLEMLDPARHGEDLFAANRSGADDRNWSYLPYGPFDALEDYLTWLENDCMSDDPLFHAIIDENTGKAVGVATYLRIDPVNGVIETGHINYSPLMQGTPAATEAMYLMMARVFDGLGYRRYEWKCDSLNGPSNAAARRLGFTYEGLFRQAVMYKGRNRDTAWYSILDTEWPVAKAIFQAWLAPENFDGDGRQIRRLAELRGEAG